MQFDLSRFLTAMLAAYLECRKDGNTSSPRRIMTEQNLAVRSAARRQLRQQARKQGGSRKEVKRFVKDHIEIALGRLATEVDENFKHFN